MSLTKRGVNDDDIPWYHHRSKEVACLTAYYTEREGRELKYIHSKGEFVKRVNDGISLFPPFGESELCGANPCKSM